MFFQISPVHTQVKKVIKTNNVNESEEISVLSLAPFTTNPKIFFEDIKVGNVASRKLLIRNPNNYNVQLNVSHNFPDDMNITLSWQNHNLEPNTEALLEIAWTPQSEGSWRYTLSLVGSKRLHRDVPIAFKSVSPKSRKSNMKTKKPSYLSKKGKSPVKKKSPALKRGMRISPVKRHNTHLMAEIPTISVCSSEATGFVEESDKENFTDSNSLLFISPSKTSFQLDVKNTIERRETYTLRTEQFYSNVLTSSTMYNINSESNERRDTYTVKTQRIEQVSSDSNSHFTDSLEMTSPDMTPAKNIQSKSTPTNPVIISLQDKFASKLQSTSFGFSPLVTPHEKKDIFNPSWCSTGEKSHSRNSSANITEIMSPTTLFGNRNSTFDLDRKSSSPKLGNISTETYVKGNISSETYTKANVSAGTYVKDTSVGDVSSLQVSPLSSKNSLGFNKISPRTKVNFFLDSNRVSSVQVSGAEQNPSSCVAAGRMKNQSSENVRNIIEANQWTSNNNKNPLCSIKEESYTRTSGSDSEKESPFKKPLKRRSDTVVSYLSPKRSYIENRTKPKIADWSKKGTYVRKVKKTSGLNIQHVPKPDHQQKDTLVTVENTQEVTVSDPFILAATSSVDPFMTSTLYFDEEWVEEQEKNFKKWLNALLTPPEDLNSNVEGPAIDVAKLWQQCKKVDVAEAPSKETVSSKYCTNARLNSLRKAAQLLYMSAEMSNVLSKVVVTIESQKLVIRQDRNIHLDLGLQSEIMSLFLSYNPLWLRIGLETIYNQVIPLHSNSDMLGLSTFLMTRFFRDPYLQKKYKTIHSPKYVHDLKKFMLKKFLVLVYFLDQAKFKKLIPHDPCLFCKNAPVKESREILIRFARDTLSAVGDITKYLKLLGYVVSHKQTYIHEFDYAVKCLGADLRDGVRLTRVMEIITLQDGLTNKLRVPAISRLQKIHNTKLVFDCLEGAGFKIMHDIIPKDLVEGHKEKTLSFLWQIIYKFEAPLMVKSVTTIQTWWRSLGITMKRNKLRKIRQDKDNAAQKIQNWYRRRKLAQKLELMHKWALAYLEEKRCERAAIIIQSYFRMYSCKKQYNNLRKAVIKLQSNARRWLFQTYHSRRILAAKKIQNYVRMYLARTKFVKLKTAASVIQLKYRAYKQMQVDRKYYQTLRHNVLLIQLKIRANTMMRIQHKEYLRMKSATILIQRRYRAYRLMQNQREEYLTIKLSAVLIQRWYKSIKLMRHQKAYYSKLKWAVEFIEEKYSSNKLMQAQCAEYQKLKTSVIAVQQKLRARNQMRICRDYFIRLKESTILIQRKYRANKICAITRSYYLQLKKYVMMCQMRFRANRVMKLQLNYYTKLKLSCITIQRHYRAQMLMKYHSKKYQMLKKNTLIIQKYFRSWIYMRKQMEYYQNLKNKTIKIQELYRAKLKMRKERQEFLQIKNASLTLQKYIKGYLLMKREKQVFTQLKIATMFIQQRYRANKKMFKDRNKFYIMKQATITLQRRFRANVSMRKQRSDYLKLKETTIFIQRRYRANKSMQADYHKYQKMRNAAITIQSHFRSYKSMIEAASQYKKVKNSTIIIQRRYRAKLQMNIDRKRYIELKNAAIITQRRFRASKLMMSQKKQYMLMKRSVILIQQHYRAKKLMLDARHEYLQLKSATLKLQRRFRANTLMRQEHERFSTLRRTIVVIQRKYKAKLEMKSAHKEFIAIRNAALAIQRRYRAMKLMKYYSSNYKELKNATLIIQRKFRAQHMMKKEKQIYLKVRNSAVLLQRRFKAHLAMIEAKNHYNKLRKAVISIQQKYRATKLMKVCRDDYLKKRKSASLIQNKFRAYLQMRKDRNRYLELQKSTIFIQRLFRANKEMKMQCKRYRQISSAVKVIQQHFRAAILAKKQRNIYLELRKAVTNIQRKYRAKLLMKRERAKFLYVKKSCLTIQKYFRAYRIGKEERYYYYTLKNSTLFLQRQFRAKLAMKVEYRKYTLLRNAVVNIQRRYRSQIEMKKHFHNYQKLKQYTIIVQRRYRAKQLMFKERLAFIQLKHAIHIIESRYIAYKQKEIARSNYLLLKQVTVSTQQRFRAKVAMQKQRTLFLTFKRNIVTIQRQYRALRLMQQQKLEYMKIKQSIIVIQNWWRSILTTRIIRMQFLQLKKSTILIQRTYRRYKIYKNEINYYIKLRQCTINVQRRFRGLQLMRKSRNSFLKIRATAIYIQRRFRSYKLMKQEQTIYIKQKMCILRIQSRIRGFLVRKKYAHLLTEEAKEQRRIQRKQIKAATKIQALWRGHRTRSVEKPELAQIRQRSKDATSNAMPEHTLGFRSKQAVQLLITDNVTLFQILRALEDLEYITRRCRVTCLQLSKILPEQLYTMISCTSRSLPEMNACNLATHILINFCKYSETSKYSWEPDYMDKMVTVMLHWCDKESFVFPSLCTLLWLFAHKEEYKTVIKSIPNYQQRIMKIENLCTRKYKMVSRTGVKGVSLFGPYAGLPKPSLTPDWGLDYKDKPKTFTNSMHALKCLLNILQ